MLSLTNDLMDTVKFDGHIYNINFSFDVVIQYLELAENKNLDDYQKFIQATKLFFGDQELPDDQLFFEYAFKAINKEIDDQPYKAESSVGFDGSIQPVKYLSYKQDAGAIYASFYQQYHIDLMKERGKMHWSVFQALFDGLGEDTPIERIIQIRQKSPSEVDTNDQAKLLQLQNQFAIRTEAGKQEKKKSVDQLLSNDAMQSAFNSLLGSIQKGG